MPYAYGMTIELSAEQAAAIGKVLEGADGYCTSCASDLADAMAMICPGHDWMALVGLPDDEDAGPRFDIAHITGGRVVFSADEASGDA